MLFSATGLTANEGKSAVYMSAIPANTSNTRADILDILRFQEGVLPALVPA